MKTCPTSLSNAKALKRPYCKPLGLKRKQNREQSSETLPGLSPHDQRWLQDPGSPSSLGPWRGTELPEFTQTRYSLQPGSAWPRPSLCKQADLSTRGPERHQGSSQRLPLTQIAGSLAHSPSVERRGHSTKRPPWAHRKDQSGHGTLALHVQLTFSNVQCSSHRKPSKAKSLPTTKRQGTLSTRMMFRERIYLEVVVFQDQHEVHSRKLPENFESNPEATVLNVPVIPWTSS